MGWPWGPPEPLTGLARVLSAGPKKVCQDLRGTGLSATLSVRGDLEGSGGRQRGRVSTGVGKKEAGFSVKVLGTQISQRILPQRTPSSRMSALWRREWKCVGRGFCRLTAVSLSPRTMPDT